ncbi:hypothetical protein QYE76_034198 [Lolium multiflorum]|uniref:Uncharacterized protein n=1 Tax=Lolium multiflorum TaxID=4521 RepID=A0AAD8QY52_LOLMU|nr:hypothetical protein QYE76_034198 [Lolium multiflorum]
MTRRVVDPRWLPWLSNAEVKEVEENAAAEAEPAGASSVMKSRLPEPAPPKPTRSTEICPAWLIWIRLQASPLTPTATASGSMISNRPEAGYKRARKHRPRGKGGKGKDKDKEEDSSEAMDEDDASPDPKEGFVSRLGEKALSLYKLLKKTDKFVWDDAADAALQGLKEILTSPPILAAPEESEPMLLYLAASNKVISLVVVVEAKGRRSRP